MASFEDFDSDTDDEFLKDVVALPLHPASTATGILESPQNVDSVKKLNNDKDEKIEVIHVKKQTSDVVKDFKDVSFSSDNFLTDSCRGHQCSIIQEAWISGGMGGQQVKQLAHKLFSSSQNPHLSAVYLMYHSYDFFKNKTNSLAAFVVDQFEVWLEEFHKTNGYYPSVDQQTAKEAMVAVSRQKNGKILKKIVNMYHGVHFKTQLIEVVNELVHHQEFASACRLAVALELFSDFQKEDFVLPLIVQDKLPLAEEYLKKNCTMQQAVVSFLDRHIKQPCEMLHLISQRSLPDVNYEKMNSKNIANMVIRLAKRFELDDESHPETILRQKIGALRYLVHKKYNERSIDDENWTELVEIAVANSLDLQVELIQQLQCIDDEAATRYAEIYAIPEERLPYNFSPFIRSDSCSQAPIKPSNEMLAEIEGKVKAEFYALKMPFENIHWICSWESVQEFFDIVSKSAVVGIDVEWPPFGTQLAKATVLQIATHNKIFILDIFSLREDKTCSIVYSRQLIRILFSNPHILKLGYGLKEDLQVLSRSLPGIEDVSKSVVNWIDIKNLWSNIESKYPLFVPSVVMNEEDILLSRQETHKGLSGLVKQLLGLPLDKKEQFSDWQKRPLRRSQLIYAALDAFCLLEVYDFLQKRSQFLEIDWPDVLKKLGTVHHFVN